MMKGIILVIALFCLSSNHLLAQEIEGRWFSSNALGQPGEEVVWYNASELDWSLQFIKESLREQWILYRQGDEEKRWVYDYYHTLILKGTQEFQQGSLYSETAYDPLGRLLRETIYGASTETRTFRYTNDQRTGFTFTVDSVEQFDQNIFRDDRGRLRRVERIWSDGTIQSEGWSYQGDELIARWTDAGDLATIRVLDSSGFTVLDQRYLEGELIYEMRNEYIQGVRQESSLNIPDENTVTRQIFSQSGLLLGTETRRENDIIAREAFRYDGEVLIERTRETLTRIEITNYSYNDEGDLTRIVVMVNGQLEKITSFPEDDERVEELFDGGELFLIVYFFQEEKIREEYFLEGELVREVDFNEDL